MIVQEPVELVLFTNTFVTIAGLDVLDVLIVIAPVEADPPIVTLPDCDVPPIVIEYKELPTV